MRVERTASNVLDVCGLPIAYVAMFHLLSNGVSSHSIDPSSLRLPKIILPLFQARAAASCSIGLSDITCLGVIALCLFKSPTNTHKGQ